MIRTERREIFEIDATPVYNVMSGEEQKSNNQTFTAGANVAGDRLYTRPRKASVQQGCLCMILADHVPYASRHFASIVVLSGIRVALCHLVVVQHIIPIVPRCQLNLTA